MKDYKMAAGNDETCETAVPPEKERKAKKTFRFNHSGKFLSEWEIFALSFSAGGGGKKKRGKKGDTKQLKLPCE